MQMASKRMVQSAQPPCAAGELAGPLPEMLHVSPACGGGWVICGPYVPETSGKSHLSECSHQGCTMTV